VGGGITGIVSSYFLTRDPQTNVLLLERNKICLGEASGQDMGVFNPAVSTRLGQFNSLWRVDGPHCVYLSHMIREPGTFKFLSFYLLSKINLQKIEQLTVLSQCEFNKLIEMTGITNPQA